MGTLSVREHLLFSANLRLDPQFHSSADKLGRVDTILEELGLTECSNTKPRYSIFEQFDQLTLMHKGEVAYAGQADEALEYFSLLDDTNPLVLRYRQSPQCQQVSEQVAHVCRTFEGGFQTKTEKVQYVTSFSYQVCADLIPNRIIPVLVFSAISYYMMGLKPAFVDFLCFTLTMSLTSIAAVSVAFVVSASVSSLAMANIFVALPFVVMMVFGGFLVNLNNMLSWLSWLEWISIFKYGMNAMFITEMTGQLFFVTENITIPGEMFLKGQSIDYSQWGFWQNQVALCGISSVCMALAYLQLRRINRWK
ncbi:hypothetical protein NHX12_017883 [Muraenolepis orangiensis]|uniref:ABC-2 type transporter transmembrane domain-containing protein n=1 Tax=Muraenolepis orangiensis TaxID=630683 RepID=A0A9Q0EVP8_9TELE|nr:hypothetical protein NHX12_017883 [Muraenolepis orangiensis]